MRKGPGCPSGIARCRRGLSPRDRRPDRLLSLPRSAPESELPPLVDDFKGTNMVQTQDKPAEGFCRELLGIARLGRQVWRLVPWSHRCALGGAVLVMGLGSAASTA